MLSHLVIRNFAIIEHLEIPFNRGFTVLTGETGAGKSIIIDALNLLLGGRAMTEVIRTDEDEAVVEGIFEPKQAILDAINTKLEDRGIQTIDHQIMVRRIVSRSGRNKVFINGSLTTVTALGELTAGLVDISGQHEHYSLLDPEGHVDILDSFAELEDLRERVATSFAKVASIRRELSDIRKNVRQRASRIDYLGFQLAEIDAASLVVGEEEDLARELDLLRHAEKLQDAGRKALYLSYEADASSAQQLSESVALLSRVGPFDDAMQEFADRMEEAQIIVEEIARDLRSHIMGIDSDPLRLDVCIERGEVLKKLKRKHGESIAEILDTAEQMRTELERLRNADERGQHLEDDLREAELETFKLSRRLSRARREAARLLEQVLESELSDLNMARTRFVVSFSPAELPEEDALGHNLDNADLLDVLEVEENEGTSDRLQLGVKGFDQVEFLISPNVGESPKPLAKIASGGELSRVMLVMKSALLDRDTVSTYVFDEVDTGIGGSTADMVGLKIEKTASEHQVLCITHLPQIASRCTHHYLVEKSLVNGRTQSTIRPLEMDEQVAEIARMLGGARVTSTTMEAAREMISGRPRI
ncbi:MAG: DNA repair protein RecN [Myxococcota bacterium]|jgi:DNA repair protein RecN (Recombination protein N)|nr:DNA repair protein RecN [Myxococcota bacterium]